MFTVRNMIILMLIPIIITALVFLWLAFLPNPMA